MLCSNTALLSQHEQNEYNREALLIGRDSEIRERALEIASLKTRSTGLRDLLSEAFVEDDTLNATLLDLCEQILASKKPVVTKDLINAVESAAFEIYEQQAIDEIYNQQ